MIVCGFILANVLNICLIFYVSSACLQIVSFFSLKKLANTQKKLYLCGVNVNFQFTDHVFNILTHRYEIVVANIGTRLFVDMCVLYDSSASEYTILP